MAEKVRMAQSYKALKESFVSNLSGGKVSEVNYVTAVAPVRSVDILSLRELIGTIFLGSRSSLVYTSRPSRPFRQLWPSRFRGRLSPQRWSNSPCNDVVLLKPNNSQSFPNNACLLTLHAASSACSPEDALKAR